MKKLTLEEFKYIESWINNKARDLEVAIFNHYFNQEDKEMVLHALTLFQNKDGGFDHGLEPDSLNPNSSPIQTWYALSILKSVGYKKDKEDVFFNLIINKVFNYLFKKAPLIDNKWPFTILSNNDYPCAFWWKHDENNPISYNPTAALIGYALYFLEEGSPFYKKAYNMLKPCIDNYLYNDINDKHEINCYFTLVECIKELNLKVESLFALETKLINDGLKVIQKDKSKWNDVYPNLPLDIFNKKEFIIDEIKDLINDNLDFLIENRKANGMWDITWTWGNDYPQFEVSRIKWCGILAVNNLIILNEFNRIEGVSIWKN